MELGQRGLVEAEVLSSIHVDVTAGVIAALRLSPILRYGILENAIMLCGVVFMRISITVLHFGSWVVHE